MLYLREMALPCTEEQMEALTSRLSRPEAFGPVSAWGPEVFTEIGTLAGTVEQHIPEDMNLCYQQFLSKESKSREMTAPGWICTVGKDARGKRLEGEI